MRDTEDLLRTLAPQVLGALVRRYGHFDTAEDATQEALLAAATRWPAGRPDNPLGWLITVASRRLTDLLRNEAARRRREDTVAQWTLTEPSDTTATADADDTLILLFMCAHPALQPASQIALTLRAVGGLTTTEIARAFLVPETTMARRITRAKQKIKDSGIPFAMPTDRDARLAAVLHVLYLVFTEGYAATLGPNLYRDELSAEAIRLTRLVHRLLPDDGEVTGLLALMLLTDARHPARTDAHGMIVPMAEQDRSLWHADQIAEGIALVSAALPRGDTGPYQLQAAIAALHDEAPSATETDWPQILALYDLLLELSDNPVVNLNHVVAHAMVHGPTTALARLAEDTRLTGDHRYHTVRAHLLELAGDHTTARAAYRKAADIATSLPHQRYLNTRADRLT